MDVIICPCCGQNVAEKTEKCPFCGTVLVSEKEKAITAREVHRIDLKDNLIGILTSIILAISVHHFWAPTIETTIVQRLGVVAKEAFISANAVFSTVLCAILIVCGILLSVWPLVFKKGKSGLVIASVILIVLFSAIGYMAQRYFVMNADISAEKISYSSAFSLGLGVAFPLFFGSLSLLGYKRSLPKVLIIQLGISVLFFALTVLLDFLMIMVLDMNVVGISIANLISSVIVFIISILLSKGFKKNDLT